MPSFRTIFTLSLHFRPQSFVRPGETFKGKYAVNKKLSAHGSRKVPTHIMQFLLRLHFAQLCHLFDILSQKVPSFIIEIMELLWCTLWKEMPRIL